VIPDKIKDLRRGKRYQFSAIDIFTKIRFCFIYNDFSNSNSEEFYHLINLPSLNNQKLQMKMQKLIFDDNFLRIYCSCVNMPTMKYFLYKSVTRTGS